MANLKDIKNRIQSVENTKKITRAMKMVAAAKVKKAESTVKSARPFATMLVDVFKRMLSACGTCESSELNLKSAIEDYPALLTKRPVDSVGLLVITSNKGLAGAYNANIIRHTLKAVKEYEEKGITPHLFIVGQKGISSIKRKLNDPYYKFEIAKTYIDEINNVTAEGTRRIAEDIAQYYVDKKIDKIEIVTTKFKNMMSYSVEDWTILPIEADKIEAKEESKINPLMLFEPNEKAILQKIVPMYITNLLYQALLEAQASELASRMTAMSAASNNAEDMIRVLTIDYNKARQWAITQELVEIVSGADALK